MEPRILPSPDESRHELPKRDEPLLPFVLAVVLVDAEAQGELEPLFYQLSQAVAPAAYIIMLAPEQQSGASDITAALPATSLPWVVVRGGEALHPGTIFIVPNRSSAVVHEGNILLTPLSNNGSFIEVTNALLASVARQPHCAAITVYLSNNRPLAFAANSHVREAGGFALHAVKANSFQEANAVAPTDVYDLVVPAETLPAEMRRLVEGIDALQSSRFFQISPAMVQPILTLLRAHLGFDLLGYNLETISQRINRRMLLRSKDISTYYTLLQSSPTELQTLGTDILMPFTRFFRDADAWARLSEVGLPQLFQRGADKIKRIWSAGCSTGEEAYSLAMLLMEYQERTELPLSFVIFATDIDAGSLLFARAGLYSHTIEQELSPERLKRFFRWEEGGYRVVPELRDLCVFSGHNVCFDAPWADIDLLLCRDTLKYFGPTLQEQALANIQHALTPRGICMLGEADVTGSLDSRLIPLDADYQLYFKGFQTMANDLSEQQISHEPMVQATMAATAWDALSLLDGPVALQRYADNLVAARFGPPGIIVDSELNVVEIRGELAPFVQISAGLASRKLQQLIKPALAGKVVELVRAASSGNKSLAANCILPPFADSVRVEVLPLPTGSPRNHFFLVLLQLVSRSRKKADEGGASVTTGISSDEGTSRITRYDPTMPDLAYRQRAQQQHSGSGDSHTAAPHKPESLQSTGQVPSPQANAAERSQQASPVHYTRPEQARGNTVNTDAQVNGLIAGIGIPLLLLDRDLKLVLLSPRVTDILGLSPTDVGKVLTSADAHLNDFGLAESLLREVLQTLRTHEQEVQDRQQHWYRIVIRPHQVANETVGLIVMFVDIDTERTLRHQLIQARDFAACVLQQIPMPLAVLHADLTFRSANAAFQRLTGTAGQKLEGWPLGDFTQRFWGVSADAIELHKLETLPIGGLIETEFSTRSAPGQMLLLKGQALLNGSARVLLLVAEDVTLRRETERVLARQQTALADQLENRDTLLKVTQKELHDLAQHLFTVQEQERERIASELHDDVSQRLSLLQMACSRLSQLQHPTDEQHEIESILQQVQSLSSDVRVMSHNLHPALLKQLGLVVALKSLIDDFREKENLPATLTSTIGALHPSDLASTTCYRVVQEALRNVAKHAGRTHVKVSLDVVGDRLRLQIRDFGNGFDQTSHFPQPGLGLTSMRERTRIAGGTFSVVSTLGEGTVIVVEVPAGVDV